MRQIFTKNTITSDIIHLTSEKLQSQHFVMLTVQNVRFVFSLPEKSQTYVITLHILKNVKRVSERFFAKIIICNIWPLKFTFKKWLHFLLSCLSVILFKVTVCWSKHHIHFGAYWETVGPLRGLLECAESKLSFSVFCRGESLTLAIS